MSKEDPVFTGTNTLLVKLIASLRGSWDDTNGISDLLVQCEEAGFIKRYTGKSPKRTNYENTVRLQKKLQGNDPLFGAEDLEAYREALESDRCPEALRELFKGFTVEKTDNEEEDERSEEKGSGRKRGRKKDEEEASEGRSVSPEAKSQKVADSDAASPKRTPRKRPGALDVGVIYDAELDGSRAHYTDVIHPVVVLKFNAQKNLYHCKLMAFWEKDSKDWYSPDQLHPMRGAGKGPWKEGDRVHIRIRNRKVAGEPVDGNASDAGVWVKAQIVSRKNNLYKVSHVNWANTERTKESTVVAEDIRDAYNKK